MHVFKLSREKGRKKNLAVWLVPANNSPRPQVLLNLWIYKLSNGSNQIKLNETALQNLMAKTLTLN